MQVLAVVGFAVIEFVLVIIPFRLTARPEAAARTNPAVQGLANQLRGSSGRPSLASSYMMISGTLPLLASSAVRPALGPAGKPAPRAPGRVVFLASEPEHVITQEDERVGLGPCCHPARIRLDWPPTRRRQARSAGRCPIFGSEMGAAKLSQAASDTVIGTVRRSLTWAHSIYLPVWAVARSVRD